MPAWFEGKGLPETMDFTMKTVDFTMKTMDFTMKIVVVPMKTMVVPMKYGDFLYFCFPSTKCEVSGAKMSHHDSCNSGKLMTGIEPSFQPLKGETH